MNAKRSLLLVCGFLASTLAAFAVELRLNITEYPPYNYTNNGAFVGVGVERVQALLKSAGLSCSLSVAPNFGKAVRNMADDQSDGFFLASRNSERDSLGVFIGPIMTSRWTWFLPADTQLDPTAADFSKKAVVSALINSNQHSVLLAKQYQMGPVPQSAELLITLLLEKKRVDAVLTADLVFYAALEKAGIPKDKVKAVLFEEKPFGLYLSKKCVAENPGIVEKLNAALKDLK